ncbi:mannosyltransferase [Rhizoclosmatium sp. JEL0117]|nr:mannosyltransferase [Rhizoclosmatium sp. JEL0117]
MSMFVKALAALLLVRVLAAVFYSVISDCDEVFNYWEPTHFLVSNSNRGFQTWEYSPEFNIRSWAFAALYSIVPFVFGANVQSVTATKTVLALVSAASDAALVSATYKYSSAAGSYWLLLFLIAAPGMTAASTAYLPSTFSMYLTTLAFAQYLNPTPSTARTSKIVFYTAASVLVGWPFSGAVAIPFLIEDLLLDSTSSPSRLSRFIAAVKAGVTAIVAFLVPTVLIDRIMYGFWSIVPLNIVLYNVLNSGDGKGPDIFGTEPWYFYLLNGFLNFNVVFLAALAAIPCVLLNYVTTPSTVYVSPTTSLTKTLSRQTPFLLWLAIFSAQPHKEERFLFVVYPILCYSAATAITTAQSALTNLLTPTASKSSKLKPKSLTTLPNTLLTLLITSTFLLLSLTRTLAMITNYSAPLHIYSTHVSTLKPPQTQPERTTERLCIGKEWHRFPSHFYIPAHIEVRLLKSEFQGLLPAKFGDSSLVDPATLKRWEITRLVPDGLNEYNKEDTSRYVAPDTCTYLVDSDFGVGSELEPRYVEMKDAWDIVACERVLDQGKSRGVLGKVFWVPEGVFGKLDGRVWGRYCLLKRIK